jgi:hypothetical protein
MRNNRAQAKDRGACANSRLRAAPGTRLGSQDSRDDVLRTRVQLVQQVSGLQARVGRRQRRPQLLCCQ